MTPLRSLWGRLALLYAAIAAAMLVAAFAIAAASIEEALVNSAAERLEIEAGLVVADAAGGRRPTAVDLAAGDLASLLGGYGTAVAIIDADGNVLAAEQNGAERSVQETRLQASDYAGAIAAGTTMHAVRSSSDGERTLVVLSPVQLRTSGPPSEPGQGQGQGRGLGNQKNGKGPFVAAGPANAVAQLAISLASIDDTLGRVRETLQLAALGLLLFAVMAVWVVTRFGLRPLESVARAANSIARGDLSARASLPAGNDELGRLGRAFDGMADRVDATLRAQRAFAADASHELRSPLTVLGGYVDILSRGEIDADTRSRTLSAMRREIDRLSRLSADLLLLTQLEAGGGRLTPREVDLGLLVDDIGAAARVIAPNREVAVDRDGPLPVRADPDRLTQSLMNLVDNAVRHTPDGGTIRITAARVEGAAVVAVANPGTPIAAADLPRVFDRFFRADDAVGRNGQHAGLGLAIVKAIVEASGGTVAATSGPDETRFEIRLPIAR
ncbi:MAG TPA: ATP-binding protein [Candidatus Limnocylindria bacterium]|nr:ATP-binding protein [Candidatus Limnocylindria bacterium]